MVDLDRLVAGAAQAEDLPSLDTVRREYTLAVLQHVGGNISRCARVLGVDRRTLYRNFVAWQITVERPVREEPEPGERTEARWGRDIVEVIDALIALVPELEESLRIQKNAGYTAPEVMGMRWAQAQEVLAERVPEDHPKYAEVRAIWNGEVPA